MSPDLGLRSRNDPQKDLVAFIVGGVRYAIDINRVREIVNPLPLTPMPHTPEEIAGVTDHPGEVLPILDLRVRFGLPATPPTRSTKWILVNVGSQCLGLIVDEVTEVFGTGGENLRPPPNVGGKKDIRGISGVTSRAGVMTFVLDTTRLAEMAEELARSGSLAAPPNDEVDADSAERTP
jgi:purine-binding chemotaxis protein CheW